VALEISTNTHTSQTIDAWEANINNHTTQHIDAATATHTTQQAYLLKQLWLLANMFEEYNCQMVGL
jgi:hypothetical protein